MFEQKINYNGEVIQVIMNPSIYNSDVYFGILPNGKEIWYFKNTNTWQGSNLLKNYSTAQAAVDSNT